MIQTKQLDNLILNDSELIFCNFEGSASNYNAEGNRNFCVVIKNKDLVKQLKADGWNVKCLEDKELYYLRVYLGKFPEQIRLPKGYYRADVVVVPFQWELRTRYGVKAFLGSIVFKTDKGDANA